MSKAISEDSEGKRASAGEFGVRQLFRRPAPTTELAIKSFVATLLTDNSGIQVAISGYQNIYWDTSTNRNPECFEEQHDATTSPLFDKLRILEDGVYTVSIRADLGTSLAYGTQNVAVAMFRNDNITLASKTWPYDSTQGYADIHDSWTFEMDGTGGSNRAFSIQFINFHPPIAGTDDEIQISGLELAVHKWPGTITL
jgi:hypothetical protein